MSIIKEFEEFKKVIKKEIPEITYRDINHLFETSYRLHKYFIKMCNKSLYKYEEKSLERDEYFIQLICNKYNLTYEINQDPRGYALKFKFPSGYSNGIFGDTDLYGIGLL